MRRVGKLLNCCLSVGGKGSVKNKLQIWLQVGIQLGPGPGHSVILSNCSCSVCMQKESLSFCAHGQEKLVSFARRERDSHWANESISRVGYTLLPRSPSRSRRMFLLRFFTRLSAPLRKCLSTSLPQSRCYPMLLRSPFATRCFLQFKRVRWTCPWKGIHIHEQSGVAAATRTTATRGGEEPKPSKEMKIITRAEPEPRAKSSLSLSPSPTRSHWNSTHARATELEAVQQVCLGVSVLTITFVTDFGWAIKWSSKCYYDCISGRIIVCQGITWLQLTLGILTMLPLARCRSCCGQKNLLPTIKLSVSGRNWSLIKFSIRHRNMISVG